MMKPIMNKEPKVPASVSLMPNPLLDVSFGRIAESAPLSMKFKRLRVTK